MTISTTAQAVRGGLLTAVLLLAGTAPAQAAPAPAQPLSGDYLYLTVTKGDARSSDTRGTLLMCDPPQGHALAAEACAELAAADGDIAALPPKDVFCPMVYAPVSVHARGMWGGREVEYAQTFPNGCAMSARTGSVFAFDS
ncbi:SSI family serine proteinase inhibitor [Streptomyces sp. NPDC059690]|uniref:SSI family serine proteinase inhibitor n=1 Tax=Streptomyces sp. NPDC059690 TaxID=3346907 RepID=UPI0036B50514